MKGNNYKGILKQCWNLSFFHHFTTFSVQLSQVNSFKSHSRIQITKEFLFSYFFGGGEQEGVKIKTNHHSLYNIEKIKKYMALMFSFIVVFLGKRY